MGKLYVGNLSWSTTDEELKSAFEGFGEVRSASVIMDRETGRSRGFGFVELDGDLNEAISVMDGKDLGGRQIKVNEARERPPRRY